MRIFCRLASVLFLFAVAFCFSSDAFANASAGEGGGAKPANERDDSRFKVCVRLAAQDELSDKAKEWMLEGLSKIDDIQIVDYENGEYILSVNVRPIRLMKEDGAETKEQPGFVLSVVYWTNGPFLHELYTKPVQDLKQTCQEIVTRFDFQILDPLRQHRE